MLSFNKFVPSLMAFIILSAFHISAFAEVENPLICTISSPSELIGQQFEIGKGLFDKSIDLQNIQNVAGEKIKKVKEEYAIGNCGRSGLEICAFYADMAGNQILTIYSSKNNLEKEVKVIVDVETLDRAPLKIISMCTKL